MIFYELFYFLKRPSIFSEIRRTGLRMWQDLGALFVATYIIKSIYLFTVSKYIRTTFDIGKSIIVQDNQSVFVFFLLAIIAYPVLEEFLFRYWLSGKKVVTLLILIFTFLILSNWILTQIYYPSAFVRSIAIVINSLSIISILLVNYFRLRASARLDQVFIKYFPLFYYFSVAAFGFVHILNFDLGAAGIWSVFLIVPFILSGVTLGYVRVRYGIVYSIAMHIAFNLTTFLLDKVLGL